jgi:YHS domain-containing protein/positive regulator of sigma E activity
MRRARGIVTAVAEKGKARVAIRTDDALPGCSSKTEHCHHCSAGTSSLEVNVCNRAGAGVGDTVSVLFKSGAVLKSVLILLGIPMTGIVAGAILGVSLQEASGVSQEGSILAGAACFGVAVLLAVITYRHFSEDIQPYIHEVIAPGSDGQGTTDPVCGMAVNPGAAAGKLEYEGKTYFFCSSVCMEAFIREPARYLVADGKAPRCKGT